MHLYDDIWDALSSLRGSTSSFLFEDNVLLPWTFKKNIFFPFFFRKRIRYWKNKPQSFVKVQKSNQMQKNAIFYPQNRNL